VDLGNSQRDKCQVGNMHSYTLDLVHFVNQFDHSMTIR
jgi:hypothetical protein